MPSMSKKRAPGMRLALKSCAYYRMHIVPHTQLTLARPTTVARMRPRMLFAAETDGTGGRPGHPAKLQLGMYLLRLVCHAAPVALACPHAARVSISLRDWVRDADSTWAHLDVLRWCAGMAVIRIHGIRYYVFYVVSHLPDPIMCVPSSPPTRFALVHRHGTCTQPSGRVSVLPNPTTCAPTSTLLRWCTGMACKRMFYVVS